MKFSNLDVYDACDFLQREIICHAEIMHSASSYQMEFHLICENGTWKIAEATVIEAYW